MSWDAVFLRIRGPVRPIEEVADDDYLPLGIRESIAAAVRLVFPDADWDSPNYARYGLDKYTAVTIDLQHVETSNSIHVSVSEPGNPIPALLSLANANGWVVLDCSTGEILDPASTSSEGFTGYKSLWEGLQGRGRGEE